MSKIICQMVCRNEADRYLVEVINHAWQFADLIVFTDDCSTDETPYIAATLGCKVAQTDTNLFVENEGILRNLAWSHLETYAEPGDWVLGLDGDEKLYGWEQFPKYLDQSQYDVLGVVFYHLWNTTHYRTDKAWSPTVSTRLFRYYPGGSFPNRKLACGSEPDFVRNLIYQGKFNSETPFRMMHLGYVKDEDKVLKYKRYQDLDGGQFHARAHIESILDSDPHLVPWID